MDSRDIIVERLKMQPHPEGGFFKEVYRCSDRISSESLPDRFSGGERSVCTAIYFMLEKGNFSAFHRIKSDEIWHHYEGCSLEVVVIDSYGTLTINKLGKNWDKGEQPMLVVSQGVWFASRVIEEGFALVGCTVAPGFDFADFELASRKQLQQCYPKHSNLIEMLTRG